MEADFDPDDEEMAEVPLPDLECFSNRQGRVLGSESLRVHLLLGLPLTRLSDANLCWLPMVLTRTLLALGLCLLLWLILPSRSCLRASSRAKSRAPSRVKGAVGLKIGQDLEQAQRRRILDGKARIVTVSPRVFAFFWFGRRDLCLPASIAVDA